MKKGRILIGFLCGIMLFLLTGCGSKTALSIDEFNKIADNNGYTVLEASNVESENIKDVKIAKSTDGWQVEFYIFDTEDNAEIMFNQNKSIFESSKGNSSSQSSINMGNYSTYTLNSDGKYMYISRVDNTFLYLSVEDDYKEDVKDFVDELGY